MIYKSERAMSDFGIGMIQGAAIWFNRKVFVGKKDISEKLEIVVKSSTYFFNNYEEYIDILYFRDTYFALNKLLLDLYQIE